MLVAPLRGVLGYERDALRYETRLLPVGQPAIGAIAASAWGRKRHSKARPAPTLGPGR
jgi:hypothetical protein